MVYFNKNLHLFQRSATYPQPQQTLLLVLVGKTQVFIVTTVMDFSHFQFSYTHPF